MANCFITEAGCKSFVLRKQKSKDEFVKEIRETYKLAREENRAIVFLDDMDKYSECGKNEFNPEEYITIQSCIDDCKNSSVFTIATINKSTVFPYSLLRPGRFDRYIKLKEPEGEDFCKIIKHFLETKKVSSNLDIEEIERMMEDNTCAALETIINDAGIFAGYDGKSQIEQEDIVRACLNRVFDVSQSNKYISNEERRDIAIHEAGHVVAGETLNPGSVGFVSINRREGEISGYTKIKAMSPTTNMNRLEIEVIQLLAGRAATELVLGKPDIGCKSDLVHAYHILVHKWNDFEMKGSSHFDPSDNSDNYREKLYGRQYF